MDKYIVEMVNASLNEYQETHDESYVFDVPMGTST